MKASVIGIDLGDKKNTICVLDKDGNCIENCEVSNLTGAMTQYFEKYTHKVVVVLEAGTHSPWVSKLIEPLGHEVLIGNPRKLRMIWNSKNKSDMRDAQMLARIGRFDPQLLHPIKHRSSDAQADLCVIKARDCLVQSRTSMINHVRGIVKTTGQRLKSCSSASFHKRAFEHLPDQQRSALEPLLRLIKDLTEQIKAYNKQIELLCENKYNETWLLRQITGVGPITALAFVLTIEEKERFEKSRTVGAFLGLTPKRDQSGDTDKQLRITKAGNGYLRQLLVSCAHYILGPFSKDCELKQFGERIAARGGKNAKRRAVVAVARKLSCVMHRLWVTGEVYDPFYTSKAQQAA